MNPAFLASSELGTAGRDGGQDSQGGLQGSYEVTSARPVGARQQPEHQADRSRTRHQARHTPSQTQARTTGTNIMTVTPL